MNKEDIDGNKYLEGKENKALRIYFYLSNGLGILNEFRNLFLAIFALYFTIKIDNLYLLGGIFIVSIIILIAIGYYQVHRGAKVREWLNIKFSTHYGMKQFDYIKGTYEVLEEIKKSLIKDQDITVKCIFCDGLGFTPSYDKQEGQNIMPGGYSVHDPKTCTSCFGQGYQLIK